MLNMWIVFVLITLTLMTLSFCGGYVMRTYDEKKYGPFEGWHDDLTGL